jgi:hypothetical protein
VIFFPGRIEMKDLLHNLHFLSIAAISEFDTIV